MDQKLANELKSARSGTTTSSTDVSSDFGNSIVSSPQSTRQPTPLNSDNEDEMTEDQKHLLRHAKECSTIPRCASAPGEKLPPKRAKEPKGYGNPASRMRDDAGPSQKAPEPQGMKAAASQKAPAAKVGQGQESPGAKAPRDPNAIRRPKSAGRAGSLRLGDGSGLTDTCVDLFNPSKT
jgi:hypothetical protein